MDGCGIDYVPWEIVLGLKFTRYDVIEFCRYMILLNLQNQNYLDPGYLYEKQLMKCNDFSLINIFPILHRSIFEWNREMR
jgi:hypothetical protein